MSEQIGAYIAKKNSNESSPKCETLHVQSNKNGRPTHKNVCEKCGRQHPIRQCPAFGKKCHNCGKMNRFSQHCSNVSKEKGHRSARLTNIVDVFTIGTGSNNAMMKTLYVQGIELEFQIDPGATVSILSGAQWNKLQKPSLPKASLKPTN